MKPKVWSRLFVRYVQHNSNYQKKGEFFMSESKQERERKIAEIYHRKIASKIGGVGIIPGGDEVIAGKDDRRDYFDVNWPMQPSF